MPKRRAISILVAILLMDPVSYLVISNKEGEYLEYFHPITLVAGSGEFRFVSPKVWFPISGRFTSEHKVKQLLVRFYQSLISLDRRFWHHESESD